MNSIQVIHPYKYHNVWVFDDDSKGLEREPFVAGADKIIDELIHRSRIRDAKYGFTLLFSDKPFPPRTIELEWIKEENNGNWYHCPQFGMDGWLCPALLKYFNEAPSKLYMFAEWNG